MYLDDDDDEDEEEVKLSSLFPVCRIELFKLFFIPAVAAIIPSSCATLLLHPEELPDHQPTPLYIL